MGRASTTAPPAQTRPRASHAATSQTAAPASVEAVRGLPLLMRFSPQMRHESSELKRFLFANLYRHPVVTATTAYAELVDAAAMALVAVRIVRARKGEEDEGNMA